MRAWLGSDAAWCLGVAMLALGAHKIIMVIAEVAGREQDRQPVNYIASALDVTTCAVWIMAALMIWFGLNEGEDDE